MAVCSVVWVYAFLSEVEVVRYFQILTVYIVVLVLYISVGGERTPSLLLCFSLGVAELLVTHPPIKLQLVTLPSVVVELFSPLLPSLSPSSSPPTFSLPLPLPVLSPYILPSPFQLSIHTLKVVHVHVIKV